MPGLGKHKRQRPMKFVVCMDSFKGSMSSLQAGDAVRRGILRAHPDAEVTVIPLADGGEGTLDAVAPYINGIKRNLSVTGPLGNPVDAEYIYSEETRTAYIEMAKAAGLTLIKETELNPLLATTYGVGELMKDAVMTGAKNLAICIGGSATNDGGAGMLQALGARLLDENGNIIGPGAAGLKELHSIDTSGLSTEGINITVASDVTNPLCGPEGASMIYGPQKGASEEDCRVMDGYLMHFADVAGLDPFEPGTGAAGGLGFALMNFLGADLKPGADMVIEITGAEHLIRDCDIVITGEGRIDSQTLSGKGPYRIMKTGTKCGKDVFGITGIPGEGCEECIAAGFKRIVPLITPSMVTEEATASLEETAEALSRSL